MVFQDPMTSLHPLFKVGFQIVEALRAHQDISKADAHGQAVEMLRRVGISRPDERVDQYPHEYSGGMRQRAMIAMALALNPDLLIADEPTTALDVTVQAQILDLIDRLKEEFNAAVVIITHDLGVVAEHCDEIKVMYAGKIVESRRSAATSTTGPTTRTRGGCCSRSRAWTSEDRAAQPDPGAPAVADQRAAGVLLPPPVPLPVRALRQGGPGAAALGRASRVGVPPPARGEGADLPGGGDGADMSVEATPSDRAAAARPRAHAADPPTWGQEALPDHPGDRVPEEGRHRARGRRRRPGHLPGRDRRPGRRDRLRQVHHCAR